MPDSPPPSSASPVQVLREIRRGAGWRVFLGRDIGGATWEIEEVAISPAAEAHAKMLQELAQTPPSGIPWRLPQRIFQNQACWQFWRPCVDATPLSDILARPPLPSPEVSARFLVALEELASVSGKLPTPAAAALLPNLLLGHDGSLLLDSPRCGAWIDQAKLADELWPYLPGDMSRPLAPQILEMRNRIALRLFAGDARPSLAQIPLSLSPALAAFARRCLPDPSRDLRPLRLVTDHSRRHISLLPVLIAVLILIIAIFWKSGQAEAAWEGLAGLNWQSREAANSLSAEAAAASQEASAASKRQVAEILRGGELGDFKSAKTLLITLSKQEPRLVDEAQKQLQKLLADDFRRCLQLFQEAKTRSDYPRAKEILDALLSRYPPGAEWNDALRLSKDMVDERLKFETAASKLRSEKQTLARAELQRLEAIEETLHLPLKDPQRDLRQQIERLAAERFFQSDSARTVIRLHSQLAEAELKLWNELFAWSKKADAASLQKALLGAAISTPGSAEAMSPLGIRYSTPAGGGNLKWSEVTPKQLAAFHRASCGDTQSARLLRAQLLLRHGAPYASAAAEAGPDFLAFAALAEARNSLENEGK